MNFSLRKHFALRSISALVVMSFFAQELALAAPAALPAGLPAPMPAVSFKIPASAGLVDDYFKAPGRSDAGKLIVLVQDAHTNDSAQFNAARVLDEVIDREDIHYVFTEADRGNVSLGYLKKYFSPQTLQSVSESFVRKGLLKGTEYLSATGGRDFTLFGVESPVLYDESLRAYADAAKGRERSLAYLDGLDRSMRMLQEESFNADLKRLNDARLKRDREELSLADYAEQLWSEAGRLGVYRETYRDLASLNRIHRLEKSIDFKTVAAQADKALGSLSVEAKDRLHSDAVAANAVKKGENAAGGFYAVLEEELRATPAGIEMLKGLPELNRYFAYLARTRRMEALRAIDEIGLLEDEVFARLARTDEEKYLYEFGRNAEDLKAALLLKMTPRQFDRFVERQSRFDSKMIGGYVNRRILDTSRHYDQAVFLNGEYESTLQETIRFYRLARKRDTIFVDRMVQVMNGNGQSRAALFTGGFHMQGIKQILKSRGISFVSVLPQVVHETDQARYEKILLDQTTTGRKSRVAMTRGMIRVASRAGQTKHAAQPEGVLTGARLAFFESLAGSNGTAPSASALWNEGRSQSMAPTTVSSGARMAVKSAAKKAATQKIANEKNLTRPQLIRRINRAISVLKKMRQEKSLKPRHKHTLTVDFWALWRASDAKKFDDQLRRVSSLGGTLEKEFGPDHKADAVTVAKGLRALAHLINKDGQDQRESNIRVNEFYGAIGRSEVDTKKLRRELFSSGARMAQSAIDAQLPHNDAEFDKWSSDAKVLTQWLANVIWDSKGKPEQGERDQQRDWVIAERIVAKGLLTKSAGRGVVKQMAATIYAARTEFDGAPTVGTDDAYLKARMDWRLAEVILSRFAMVYIHTVFSHARQLATTTGSPADRATYAEFEAFLSADRREKVMRELEEQAAGNKPTQKVVLVHTHPKPDFDAAISAISKAWMIQEEHPDWLVAPVFRDVIPTNNHHPAAEALMDLDLNPDHVLTLDDISRSLNTIANDQSVRAVQKGDAKTEVFLIDHNEDAFLDHYLSSIVTGILDHHKRPAVDFKFLKELTLERVGSSATLVARQFGEKHMDASLPLPLALLLFISIVIDTENITSNSVKPVDHAMYDALVARLAPIFDKPTARTFLDKFLEHIVLNIDGLTPRQLLEKDVKKPEKGLAGRMLRVSSSDLFDGPSTERVVGMIREEMPKLAIDELSRKKTGSGPYLAMIHRISMWNEPSTDGGKGQTMFLVSLGETASAAERRAFADHLIQNAKSDETGAFVLQNATIEDDGAMGGILTLRVADGIVQRKEMMETARQYFAAQGARMAVEEVLGASEVNAVLGRYKIEANPAGWAADKGIGPNDLQIWVDDAQNVQITDKLRQLFADKGIQVVVGGWHTGRRGLFIGDDTKEAILSISLTLKANGQTRTVIFHPDTFEATKKSLNDVFALAAASGARMAHVEQIAQALRWDDDTTLNSIRSSVAGEFVRREQASIQFLQGGLRVPSIDAIKGRRALYVDLGGSTIHMGLVTVDAVTGEIRTEKFDDLKLTDADKASGQRVFNLIAERVKTELAARGLADEALTAGFTFSFPHEKGVINAKAEGVKGFYFADLMQAGGYPNVLDLLNDRLQASGVNARFNAVANDTEAALIQGMLIDPRVAAGVIGGTGFNIAAYVDQIVTNLEAGGFRVQDIDGISLTDVDRAFMKRGAEELISGGFLGNLVRLMILDLAQKGILFKNLKARMGQDLPARNRAYANLMTALASAKRQNAAGEEVDTIQTADIVKIFTASGAQKQMEAITKPFEDLAPGATGFLDNQEDIRVIQTLMEGVVNRSADLIAAMIAGILEGSGSAKDARAAVDGAMWSNPYYLNRVNATLARLLDRDPAEPVLLRVQDASGIGAALTALAVSVQSSGARMADSSLPLRRIGTITDTGAHRAQTTVEPTAGDDTFVRAILADVEKNLLLPIAGVKTEGAGAVREILAAYDALKSRRQPKIQASQGGQAALMEVRGNEIWYDRPGFEALAAEFGVSLDGDKLRPADASAEAAQDLAAFRMLVAVSHLYAAQIWTGEDPKLALARILDFLEPFNSELKTRLINTLKRSKTYDSSNQFAFFLEMALNQDLPFQWATLDRVKRLKNVDLRPSRDPEVTADQAQKRDVLERWRMHWIHWLIARSRIDEPFDADAVREAIKTSKSTQDLRGRLHEIFKKTYDRAVDRFNIIKIWKEARRKKQSIWSVMFSRAFLLSAMSIANAQYVAIDDIFRSRLSSIREKVSSKSSALERLRGAAERFAPGNARLRERLRLASVQASSAVAQLEVLAASGKQQMPRMMVEGAVDDLQSAVSANYLQQAAEVLDQAERSENYRRAVLDEKRFSAADTLALEILAADDDESAAFMALLTQLSSNTKQASRAGLGSAMSDSQLRVEALRLHLGVSSRLDHERINARLEGAASATKTALREGREALRQLETGVREDLAAIRTRMDATAQQDAGRVFFHRRISKDIGSYEYAMIMYAIDPFTRDWTGGENERLGRMISEGAGNTYITPDDEVLERSESIQIALPLFIHNEHIDYKDLENTLRNWSEPMYRNIRRAKQSEYVALAREIVALKLMPAADQERLSALKSRPEDYEEAIRQFIEAQPEAVREAVAKTAELIRLAAESEPVILAVARLGAEKEKAGESPEPYDLLRAVIFGAPGHPASGLAIAAPRDGFAQVLEERAAEHKVTESATYKASLEEAAEPREPLRTLFIGTTQSQGMTEYLLGYWVMEGLFISRVKDEYGLNAEVRSKQGEYRDTLAMAGEVAADELELGPRVEMGMAASQAPTAEKKKAEVLYKLVTDEYRSMLERPSATLHLLARLAVMGPDGGKEFDAYVESRRTDLEAEANEALLQNWKGKKLDDLLKNPNRVQERNDLLRSLAYRERMQAVILKMDETVVAGGVPTVDDTIRQQAAELRKDAMETTALSLGITVDELARRAAADADLEKTVTNCVRTLARERVASAAAIHYGLIESVGDFDEFIDRYFYNLTAIQQTTAAKEVIGLHGLSGLALDPRFAMTHKGAFKAFNLVYLPSRIDFGADTELASIQEWNQWIGATDPISLRRAVDSVSYFNKRPAGFASTLEPENAKPNENTALLVEAINSTIAGLASNTGNGDAQMLAYYSNLRTPPSPTVNMKPASDFIAGFCLPKDWEWIRFVNRLTTEDQLKFWGITSNEDRNAVLALSREISGRLNAAREQRDFDGFVAVLREAQDTFYKNETIRRHFALIDGAYLPNVVTTSEALSSFGQTQDDQTHLAKMRRVQAWLGDMFVAQAEKVNRTLPHIKMFLTHRAWQLARKANARVKKWTQMIIVRGSEYKADPFSGAVQDPRNAPGPALLEVLARTRDYAFNMFTPEEREFAESIVWGRRPKTVEAIAKSIEPVDADTARVLRGFADRAGTQEWDKVAETLAPDRRAAIERHFIATSIGYLDLQSRSAVDAALEGTPAASFDRFDDFLNALNKKDDKLAAKVAFEWYGIEPPAEFRLVTTTGQTAKDVLGYHKDNYLDKVVEETQKALMDAGMEPEQIEAHILSYGTDLAKWREGNRGLSKLSEEDYQALRKKIGGRILVLGLQVSGLYAGYDLAAQRADIIDAGLPAPQMVALLDDAAYLRDLMLRENPDSALAIVDGAGQARPRSMTPEMVRRWFAADPRAVYTAMGVGEATVEAWRAEMNAARKQAVELYEYLTQGDFERAQEFYLKTVRPEAARRAKRYGDEEKVTASFYGRWTERDGILTQRNAAVAGMRLEDLDFASWLAAGGAYAVNGRSQQEIEDRRELFAANVTAFRHWLVSHPKTAEQDQAQARPSEDKAELTRIESLLVTPSRSIHAGEMRTESTGQGSLKATGDFTKTPEEIRRELELLKRRRAGQEQRAAAFKKTLASGARMSVDDAYAAAMRTVGNGTEAVTEADFGAFLAHSRVAAIAMVRQILPESDERRAEFEKKIEKLFNGGEITHKTWQALTGSYTDKGVIGHLAEAVPSDDPAAQKETLRQLARVAELTYIALVLERTRAYSELAADDIPQDQLWKDIAGLGAEVLYDHVFTYPPIFGQLMRGTGFSDFDHIRGPILVDGKPQLGAPFTEEEIYALGVERYAWMYTFLRNLIVTKSDDFSKMTAEEQNAHLGLVENGKVTHRAVAVGGYKPNEDVWLHIVNWREIAFYKSEKRPAPILLHIGASTLKAGERSNIMYVAPPSRQHMTAGVEEGPTLQKEGFPVNVMIGRKVTEVADYNGTGNTVLTADGAYMFLSRDEFVAAYVETHGEGARGEAEKIAAAQLKKNPKGIFVAITFKDSDPMIVDNPIPYHGVDPFTTGRWESLGYPHNVNGSSASYQFMYDKSEYHLAYDPAEGELRVMMPAEVHWMKSWIDELRGRGLSDTEISTVIIEGSKAGDRTELKDEEGQIWPGLRTLIANNPATNLYIAKAATQSGGRQTDTFNLTFKTAEGAKDRSDFDRVEAEFARAADFLLTQGTTDNFVFQQYIHAHPAMFMTGAAMENIVDRIVAEKKIGLQTRETPTSFLTIFGRIMATFTPENAEAMLRQMENGEDPDFTLFHNLFGVSVDRVGNVGRGGIIVEMLPEYLLAPIREKVFERLNTHVRESVRSMQKYLSSEAFRAKYRASHGKDPDEAALSGLRYDLLSYAMYDVLINPIFRVVENGRPTGPILENERAQLADYEYVKDAAGKVTGIRLFMNVDGEVVEVAPVDVKIVKIEDNAGTGLKHPFKEAERKRAVAEAKAQNREADITEWGRQVRVMLASFAGTGAFDAAKRYGKQVSWGRAQHDKMKELAQPRGAEKLSPLSSETKRDVVRQTAWAMYEDLQVLEKDRLSTFLMPLAIQLLMRQHSVGTEDELRTIYPDYDDLKDAIFRRIYHDPDLWDAMTDSGRFNATSVELSRILSDTAYMDRISGLAAEKFLIPQDTLSTAVAIAPLPVPADLDNNDASAVVFSQSFGATSEITSVLKEAHLAGRPMYAVRAEWIDDQGRATRIIRWNFGAYELEEIPLDAPLVIRSAWIRNIAGPDEPANYRRVARTLQSRGVSLVNPPASVNRADSKIATYHALRAQGVQTPPTLFISSQSTAAETAREINRVLGTAEWAEVRQLVIQPNAGTEGSGVEMFDIGEGPITADHSAVAHVMTLAFRGESVIVRPRVGNVVFSDDGGLNAGNVVFRVNVVRHGNEYRSGSFYGTVSASTDVLSTARRAGGHVVRISDGLFDRASFVSPDGQAAPLRHDALLDAVSGAAEKAARAMNAGLADADRTDAYGIDVVVTAAQTGSEEPGLLTHVLDVNARPAGLVFAQDAGGTPLDASGGSFASAASLKSKVGLAEQLKTTLDRLNRFTSSVEDLTSIIDDAQRYQSEHAAQLTPSDRNALGAAIRSALAALEKRQNVRGVIIDHTGAIIGQDFAAANAAIPGMTRPVTPDGVHESDQALQLSDDAIAALWDKIDKAKKAAELYGRDLVIETPLRGAAVIGGFQDAGPFISLATSQDDPKLENMPSIITVQSSNSFSFTINVARNPDGEVAKNVVRYNNVTWDYTTEHAVPIALQDGKWTPEGQKQAVAYILGAFGFHGIEITETIPSSQMLIGGGFESSNAYDYGVAIAAQLLRLASDRPMTTEQAFAMLRYMAPNVLGDRTGLQGVIAALQHEPVSRAYFFGARPDATGAVNPHSVFLEAVGGADVLEWLDAHTRGLMPGIDVKDGDRASDRRDVYTGRTMLDLIQVIKDPESVEKVAEMKKLVGVVHDALVAKDIDGLVEATRRYRDIRYGFQKRWLALAKEQGEAFYQQVEKNYSKDDFAVLRNFPDEHRAEPDLYTGGFARLIAKEKQYRVSVAPLGKGGVGANWTIYGRPEDIEAFLNDPDVSLAHEITEEESQAVLRTRDGVTRHISGSFPLQLGHPGVQVSPELLAIAPGFSTGLPEVIYHQNDGRFEPAQADQVSGARMADSAVVFSLKEFEPQLEAIARQRGITKEKLLPLSNGVQVLGVVRLDVDGSQVRYALVGSGKSGWVGIQNIADTPGSDAAEDVSDILDQSLSAEQMLALESSLVGSMETPVRELIERLGPVNFEIDVTRMLSVIADEQTRRDTARKLSALLSQATAEYGWGGVQYIGANDQAGGPDGYGLVSAAVKPLAPTIRLESLTAEPSDGVNGKVVLPYTMKDGQMIPVLSTMLTAFLVAHLKDRVVMDKAESIRAEVEPLIRKLAEMGTDEPLRSTDWELLKTFTPDAHERYQQLSVKGRTLRGYISLLIYLQQAARMAVSTSA